MKWFNSIAFRFWLTMNILILTAVLCISSFYLWKESSQLEESLKNEAISMANTLGSAIGLSMLKENYAEISPLAYSLIDQPDVKYVKIRNVEGRVINQKGETLDDPKKVMVTTVPIFYFQKEVGEIEIAVNTIKVEEQKEHVLRTTVITSIIISVISLLLSFWISGKLTLPLKKVVEATKQVTKGNRNVTVPEEQLTEINELVTSFNHMSRTIENFEDQLVNEINIATKSLSDKVSILEALSNIARSVMENNPSKKEVIRVSLKEILQYIPADKISIALWEEDNEEEILIVSLVNQQFLKEEIIPLADTPIHLMIENRQLMIRNHTTEEGIYPQEQVLLKEGIATTMMAPLITKDKVLGSLNLGSVSPNFFDRIHEEEIMMFAHQIAMALDRASLYMSLRRAAYYDHLTGLANSRLLRERIDEVIRHSEEDPNKKFAILFLDLDRFKNINDTLGHEVGDMVLKATSQLLIGNLSYKYLISRLGGDEFIILIPDISYEGEAIDCAKTILSLFNRPLRVKDYELHITGSIGISMYPADGKDADTLIKRADTAMYRVKDQGKNNFAIYAPLTSDPSYEKLALENDLRKALQKGEFIVHYQPKINIVEGTLSGFEALVRWKNSTRGLVSPGTFIPVAEETGLIVPIGAFVMKEAARQMVAWRQAGLPEVPIAVNLSTRQFLQSNLVQSVESILKETGLPPHLLELEITESMTIDLERSIEILAKLKKLGVKISIDDFGTGYSSLHYLQQLPIDRLKIDQSFVQNITVNENHAILVATIINMAKNLQLSVTAEGVETEKQATYLQKQKCEEVQGYFFSRPLSAEEIEGKYRELIEDVKNWKIG
ncbi:EAL domain-containing protein [Robertmurraya andreesenii]|uniref:Diguanylate cyclase (GGDEF)-like protein n=1 Tax=Anoxybacillus andreesenii TaxID=1325932 RepID=A0ABT9V3K5_9BACL|nr:EAL domain-containing protein [Robertmurraya andreesenii]MDQ0155525.1 diguanylate cyclase (GGDEF)-like protein [Robertmurraya andreesenii]